MTSRRPTYGGPRVLVAICGLSAMLVVAAILAAQ